MTANSAEEWGRLMAAAQAGDGAAYSKLLREILPYIRAIVRRHHTAPDRQEDVVRGIKLGANAYICKPLQPFDFILRIKELLPNWAKSRPHDAPGFHDGVLQPS